MELNSFGIIFNNVEGYTPAKIYSMEGFHILIKVIGRSSHCKSQFLKFHKLHHHWARLSGWGIFQWRRINRHTHSDTFSYFKFCSQKVYIYTFPFPAMPKIAINGSGWIWKLSAKKADGLGRHSTARMSVRGRQLRVCICQKVKLTSRNILKFYFRVMKTKHHHKVN